MSGGTFIYYLVHLYILFDLLVNYLHKLCSYLLLSFPDVLVSMNISYILKVLIDWTAHFSRCFWMAVLIFVWLIALSLCACFS